MRLNSRSIPFKYKKTKIGGNRKPLERQSSGQGCWGGYLPHLCDHLLWRRFRFLVYNVTGQGERKQINYFCGDTRKVEGACSTSLVVGCDPNLKRARII
jgi:hypothetical protein